MSTAFEYTYFTSVKANKGQLKQSTLEELLELHTATERPSKAQLPMIGLYATQGSSIAPGIEPDYFTGLALDYDKGDVTFQAMADAVRQRQLLALVHETPSSTPEQPKLRVLLPFRAHQELPERSRLLKLAIGLLPGSVAITETTTPKQRWYIGHCAATSQAELCQGFPIDLHTPMQLDTGGFDFDRELASTLESDDGRYDFFKRWIMSMAAHGLHEDELRDKVNACEEQHFPGYFDSLSAEKFKSIERAIVGAMKKTGNVVDLDSRRQQEADPFRMSSLLELVPLSRLANVKPQPPEFVVPGWIPRNAVTLLAGHGGTGKSYIALWLALRIAQGLPVFGQPVTPQKVLYLHCEDSRDVVHWRVSRFGLGYPETVWSLDGTESDNRLFMSLPSGVSAPTALYAALQQLCNGIDVLILDGTADVYGGNENDRGQVKTFINLLNALAPCVILLAHVNRTTSATESSGHDYSGSTSWHNSVRSRLALFQLEGKLFLEVQKSNWAQTGSLVEVTWNDELKVFIPGETPITTYTSVDDLSLLLLQQFAKLEEQGTAVYPKKLVRSQWDLPPRIKAAAITEALELLDSQGYLSVEEREQPNGRRKAHIYVLTERGKDLLAGSVKF